MLRWHRLAIAVCIAANVLCAGWVLPSAPLGSARGYPTHPTWRNVSGPVAPPDSAGAVLAFDSSADRFVEFGGWNGSTLNQTWVFDPTADRWTLLHPAISPPPRGDAEFVYDASDQLFYLFGGWLELPNGSYIRYADTWSYSLAGDAWTQLHPSASPPARSDAGVAYDSAANVILLVGGFTNGTYLGDEWAFDPHATTWTPLLPHGSQPSARADGRMSYDPATDSLLLFGGNRYSGPNLTFRHLDDTWVLSYPSGTWTNETAARAPPARDYAIQTYDSTDGWTLLWGGYGNGTILGDLWAFSPANRSWWPLGQTGAPAHRFAAVGGFDSVDGVLLVTGGLGAAGLLNDSWVLPDSPSSHPVGFPWLLVVLLVLGAVTLVALITSLLLWRRRGRTVRGPGDPVSKPMGDSVPDPPASGPK